MNRLYFGDNLTWLSDRKEFPDASVDLVYLDPPFNSNADYNVLFREASGQVSQAQFHAFTDTWSWADAADTYHQFIDTCPNVAVVELMEALHSFLKHSPMMAYLAMMAPRLVELHRILKETGSLYLHCDPTASHFLKMLLDGVFGPRNFRNEIIWKRSSAHSDTKQGMRRCGRIHDVLLFYADPSSQVWNPQYTPYTNEYLESEYRHLTAEGRRYKETDVTARKPGGDTQFDWRVKRPTKGKERWQPDLNDEYRNPKADWEYKAVRPYEGRYWAYSKQNLIELWNEGALIHRATGMPRQMHFADQMPGIPLQDIWTDINPATGDEDLGFDTQKPVSLVERIISASTNPGDVVLDPFCGCGTTIHAAQKLDRQWIGIDITYLAINLIKRRLKDAFGEEIEFEEKGQPTDFESAKRLGELDKFQFQHWALSLIGARPLKEGDGKGADRGVDGLLYYYETERKDIPGRVREEPLPRTEPVHREKIIVQVKGGGVNRGDVATLLGDVENQKAAGGVLITLEKPSKQMRGEAADAGRYTSKLWHDKDYPKIQVLTVEGLLNGTEHVDAPPQINPFAMAARESAREKQTEML